MFIPEMLKYSTGRGKPGWGRDSTRPVWWPEEVPWANVRRDVRTDDQKLRVCFYLSGYSYSLWPQQVHCVGMRVSHILVCS